jgi:hypothetical protein
MAIYWGPGGKWKIIFLAGCATRSKGPVENIAKHHCLDIKVNYLEKSTIR